jgi:hypothetical protein
MVNPENNDTQHRWSHPPPSGESVYVRRLLIAALIVVLLLSLWQVSLVIILIFGGVMVAVALRNISAPLGRYLHLSNRLSLIITTLGLGIIVVGFFDLFGTLAAQQFSALNRRGPGSAELCSGVKRSARLRTPPTRPCACSALCRWPAASWAHSARLCWSLPWGSTLPPIRRPMWPAC